MSLSTSVFAQSRAAAADIGGVVEDLTGLALPRAIVTVVHVDTGFRRISSTGPDGRFLIQALPLGLYEVTAEFDGFVPVVRSGVTLTLGSSLRLRMVLAPMGVAVDVTVTPPAFDAQRSLGARVVSQRQISSLPINGRDFIAFSLLSPGTAVDTTPGQGAARTSGLSFVGQRARSNNITVDGLDNNDEVVGSVRATIGQAAVREFQVLTNSYSAEFGDATGGVVNIVTKSGANDVAGNVFGYFRDRSLNAKGHFERVDLRGSPVDREKAPFGQHQVGGTVGGPIARNESFFFASFESLRTRTANFVAIDDRTLMPHPILPAQSLGTPVDILRRAGFPVTTGNVPFEIESDSLLAKIDHRLSPDTQLTVRMNMARERDENIEPWGGLVARSRGAELESQDFVLASTLTSALTTRAVNELRVQMARRDQDVRSLDPTCLGVCDLETEGGPTLEVPGYASVGRQRFTPAPRDTTHYQVSNVFSYFRGAHHIKVGGDFNYIRGRDQALPLHFGGRYIFAPQLQLPVEPGGPFVSVNAIQAVALGLPAVYVQGYGRSGEASDYQDVSWFAQDTWSPSRHLTVDLGLRYQRQFRPDARIEVTGYPGPYQLPEDGTDLAPRLSAAWDPRGDGRLKIHGAFGVFYESVITAPSGTSQFINGRADGVRSLVLPGQLAAAAWDAPGRRIPEPSTPFPSVTISLDPGFQTPYANHASVGIEQQAGAWTLGASAVWIRGFNQLGAIDYNPFVRELGAFRRPEDVGGIPLTSASVIQATSWGETWYSGLTVSAQKRFDGRFETHIGYTFSSAEDTATDFHAGFVPQSNGRGRDPNDVDGLPLRFDPRAERGPAINDHRHRLVVSGVARLPGDLIVAGILNVQSGTPYNILAGVDLNGDGDGGGFPSDRPRRNPGDETTSIGRNAGRFPARSTVDLRVTRRFPLTDRMSAELIGEVFNLLNRANFVGVQNVFGPGAYPADPIPSFGAFTQAAAPRQAQLALVLGF